MDKKAKRRAFGQHFLRDADLAQKIAEVALQKANEHGAVSLLEIGPGKGAITHPILDRLALFPKIEEFSVVEKDRELVELWKPKVRHVVSADFLEISEDQWIRKAPLAVVSNLPYSSGTAILQVLAKNRNSIPVMVLMFQAEVGRRLRAKSGTRDQGSLSVWLQNYWDVEKLFFVPPGAFYPPPLVNSEVLLLQRRKEPRIEIQPEEEAKWESFLKMCFSHRRKMLRSFLPWKNALEVAEVDGTKRAEELGWAEFDRLFKALPL